MLVASVQSSVVSEHFDARYYLHRNPDVRAAGVDPLEHYMKDGWKEGRNPRADFETYGYLRRNLDVAISGLNPFYHYIAYGKAEGRASPAEPDPISNAPHIVQDQTFPVIAETAEQVMVILIPEHNEMSGGIYSFFSIARAAYVLRRKHPYHVMLMTRSNKENLTYLRQRNFRNSEDVFRFDQIVRCRGAHTVYIHIPEYAAPSFVEDLREDVFQYLRSRKRLHINILNQRTDIMPPNEELQSLRSVSNIITQSVAHHAYFGQAFADRYGMPLLLLPAYTDLSSYDPVPFEEKDKLIIYSPDDASYKDAVLSNLKKKLPDYTLQEIRGITFDQYMDLATRSRFSITFGEGFDGYLAQPIHQGGVGFAVYNEEFFPSRDLLGFDNIFSSPRAMVDGIVDRIRRLEADVDFYKRTNQAMIRVYDSLYSREDYLRRIEMLIKRDFEIYPLDLTTQTGSIRI